MAQTLRPRFAPLPCEVGRADARPDPDPLASANDDNKWIPLIWCPADFPPELFETAVSQLIHHPEYNSTLILRSETVSETTSDFSPAIPVLRGFRILRNTHRRLLPRRPGRDAGLEQHCTLHASDCGGDAASSIATTLVLTPIVASGEPCHPPVLRIETASIPGTPTDINSRLYRTCLALLETLHRYGWGAMTNYKKRVLHDCIVPREPYQDLYLVMRERHKHLVNTWQESTDPLKHVFEDIGIATFLMLLWKEMYSSPVSESPLEPDAAEPWKSWPRPPAGFLDLGCGNGLLTHILTAEGYQGIGVDLRARTSWSHYPATTQAQLRVEALDPTEMDNPVHLSSHPYFRPGIFIIGNHADELTPWVPVVATLCSASGYLSIPCCSWAFDMRYERSSTPAYPFQTGSNTSSYSSYRIWLASLSLHLGWKIESETLRIPSTRNWAIIGRSRTSEDIANLAEFGHHAKQIVQTARERGLFKTRRPEGKAGGDH
ncbi:uncharacterized protein B0H18DRAFT_969199 [Fomitopsis serialis]|uniref:uncharacterized protein n=1 Tax=Fomitopsis serialis TaxID=139415 RepID=UPI002007C5BB|nr:uncharacterized protein B0H18DRAFT_969199 [Neoantrodia serialis]KAH9937118.1 hypothetical protein B0H18DRAFT_969199 [Neoantrodia serialis]